MLQWKIFRSRWTALIWFLIMNILFFLPGSALPDSKWLIQIDFDKFVHVGLFAGLIFLWRSAFDREAYWNSWIIILTAFIYGFMVEFIQLEWIPNRTFDLFDVAADLGGAVLGLFVWLRVYRKK